MAAVKMLQTNVKAYLHADAWILGSIALTNSCSRLLQLISASNPRETLGLRSAMSSHQSRIGSFRGTMALRRNTGG